MAHCNGDAAIDIYIEAVKNAKQKYPNSKSRITIIHAQTIRDDQLDQAK
jgi:predicted amidohydrolase YtcJ